MDKKLLDELNAKPELKPMAVYDDRDIATFLGDVSPNWVFDYFPEFRIGKRWRTTGALFADALRRRATPGRATCKGPGKEKIEEGAES